MIKLKLQGSKNRRTSVRSYANFLCSYDHNPTHVRHRTCITNSENQPICSNVGRISINLFYSFRQQIYIHQDNIQINNLLLIIKIGYSISLCIH